VGWLTLLTTEVESGPPRSNQNWLPQRRGRHPTHTPRCHILAQHPHKLQSAIVSRGKGEASTPCTSRQPPPQQSPSVPRNSPQFTPAAAPSPVPASNPRAATLRVQTVTVAHNQLIVNTPPPGQHPATEHRQISRCSALGGESTSVDQPLSSNASSVLLLFSSPSRHIHLHSLAVTPLSRLVVPRLWGVCTSKRHSWLLLTDTSLFAVDDGRV
jgi:hypothetical protein